MKLEGAVDYESRNFSKLRRCFAYDNETILSYYLASRNIEYVELDDPYHFICKKKVVIPESTVLVHAIHKDFEDVVPVHTGELCVILDIDQVVVGQLMMFFYGHLLPTLSV